MSEAVTKKITRCIIGGLGPRTRGKEDIIYTKHKPFKLAPYKDIVSSRS